MSSYLLLEGCEPEIPRYFVHHYDVSDCFSGCQTLKSSAVVGDDVINA